MYDEWMSDLYIVVTKQLRKLKKKELTCTHSVSLGLLQLKKCGESCGRGSLRRQMLVHTLHRKQRTKQNPSKD